MDISDFSQLSDKEKSVWLAAVIDTEGSIHIKKHATKSYSLEVAVGQNEKNLVLLHVLKKHFGANMSHGYQKGGNRLKSYHAFWGGEKAYAILLRIRPYLLLKATRAEHGMKFQHVVRNHGNSSNIRGECAERYHAEMRQLNCKGRAWLNPNPPTSEEKNLFDNDLLYGQD